MHHGVFIFPTDYSIRIDELARAVEERGFESLFVTEHTHIPTSRRSPFAGGGPLPKEYSHTLDPFIGLTAAAAATKNLKLGTGICLVIEHDPITLAKTIASLDLLSNGRFLFGIGAGWNAEEMENHGTPFQRRWKVLREKVEAMKAIWTQDAAEYHGEFVNFDPIWCYPKPLQKPHPPIVLGTLSAKGLKRVVNYCDGWIPVGGTVQDLPATIRELHALAERAGRQAKDLPVSIFGVAADEALLRQYQEMGIERAVFFVPSAGKDKVLPLLDRYATCIAKFA